MCVTKLLIVNTGQSIKFFFFVFLKKKKVGKYGSQDSKSRRKLKFLEWFKSYKNFTQFFCPCSFRKIIYIYKYIFFFLNLEQYTVDDGGVSRGRYVAVVLHVTCDTQHVTG